jgi:hypothetical protein
MPKVAISPTNRVRAPVGCAPGMSRGVQIKRKPEDVFAAVRGL